MGRRDVLGAVDLGSNSFHMVIARLSHGQLVVMDRLRESVRLGDGLDRRERLSAASQERALQCLARFGERLRSLDAGRVRVVGTNAMRKARRTGEFRARAGRLLGHPIEIISGIEEARLIYLGASHSLPRTTVRQLVVDIGGGSTEVILGRGVHPQVMESLYVGCVSLTDAHFRRGKLTPRSFREAREAARLELRPLRTRFRTTAATRIVGTSGTIRAVFDVLGTFGRARDGIRATDLDFLMDQMILSGTMANLDWLGLTPDRSAVFPGGVAILAEVFDALQIRHMQVADGALREGILHDMVGRMTNADMRRRTVRAMQARFRVDVRQARRVAATAGLLFRQVAGRWELAVDQHLNLLLWAGALHEIGLDIAHAQHHRHAAYILGHADMPGFARDEQALLAALVRHHRRTLSDDARVDLPRDTRTAALHLTALLRLAVLLHRSRSSQPLPALRLRADGRRLELSVPARWLRANPLSSADLEQEQRYLDAAGLRLRVRETRS
jgi:exopolyphosphatase/guanosine-5'-triphosphate,3'-diphosphate pyrophosphatase